jgi:cystathionine beta-lyase/cystathionine gamma-synthase
LNIIPQALGLSDFVDFSNEALALSKPSSGNAKLFWLETPTNSTMKAIDINKVSHMSKEQSVIDNTFCSPYFQNPLEHGADTQ